MNEQSIFAAALTRKTADERKTFLDDACGQNAGLRAQVEELLAADAAAGSFLEHPPAGIDATAVATLIGADSVDTGRPAGSLPFLESCDKPDRIGKLGVYEVIEVVGQGGMGSVLRAMDTKLSRIVAVKVMAQELAANPTAVKRFLREAQSAAAVVHDHVVTIHAVDDHSQPPYLVMEFIEGQTLQQKIDREGALQLRHILRIGSQTAAGLAAAHRTGLIHRDVKPANILLENGVERVKITDFGLARAADDVEMTKTGMIAGTPQYMSPEQANGGQIDFRSDLFSLGSVLYTMCTGRPAFRAETTMGTLRRVTDDMPRPIREVNAEIPEWLDAIVSKLLAKNPGDRFQSAAEVAELLSQYLAHVQNPSHVPRPADILLAPAGAPATRAAESKPDGGPQATRRHKRSLAIATLVWGLIALALATAITVFGPTAKRLAFNEAHPGNVPVTPAGSPLVTDDGWTRLFNGADLNGWKAIPAQNWRVENGVIHGSGPDGFLVTDVGDFEDFHLVVEYRINEQGDSGIHFRMPAPQASRAARWGYSVVGLEAEIGVRPNPGVQSGALTIKNPDLRVLTKAPTRPHAANEWARLELIALQDHIQILLNGKLVTDYIDRDRTFQRGHIALSSWEGNNVKTAVEFRKVEIRKLPPPRPGGEWTQLFNGRDLTGWKVHSSQPNNWSVEDGVLVGTGGFSNLFSERDDYVDFELRLEARISENGNSGVMIRSEYGFGFDMTTIGGSGQMPRGMEVDLHPGIQPEHAGSIWHLGTPVWAEKASQQRVRPDGWFTLNILAQGNELKVQIDGITVLQTNRHVLNFRSGHIALLQQMAEKGEVRFRKIEIRELPPAKEEQILKGSPATAIAPFGRTQAREHQARWAGHLGIGVEETNSLGMKFQLIPPGEFERGSSDEELNRWREVGLQQKLHQHFFKSLTSEGPQHHVVVSKPFYLGATEVTVGQFRKFVEAEGYKTNAETDGRGGAIWVNGDVVNRPDLNWKTPGIMQDGEMHPVTQVSWNDALAFCQWLSEKEGRTYRLPTEAEWEHACRAGTTTSFHSGAALRAQDVDNTRYVGRTHPVELFAPNPFGLYGMHANVIEWCADVWDQSTYARLPARVVDPAGPGEGTVRVQRGGAWGDLDCNRRSASRRGLEPGERNVGSGFRVVMTVNPLGARTAPGSTGTQSATQ